MGVSASSPEMEWGRRGDWDRLVSAVMSEPFRSSIDVLAPGVGWGSGL